MNVVVDNVWTNLEVEKEDNDLLRAIQDSMSYVVTEYVKYRRAYVDFDFSLFDRDKLRYPTGLFSNLKSVLNDRDVSFSISDVRTRPSKSGIIQLHGKQLRDYQSQVVDDAVASERGIIKLATGGGKTVIAAGIIARLNLRTLFIVNSVDLLEQAYDSFRETLQVPIGRIGGGYCEIEKINVCTVQTLHSVLGLKYEAVDDECYIKENIEERVMTRKEEIREVVEKAEVIINDECHHSKSSSFVNTMKHAANAYYKFGLCLHKKTKVRLADGRNCSIHALYHFASKNNPDKVYDVITFNTKKHVLEVKKARVLRIPAKNKRLYEIEIRKENGDTVKVVSSAEHRFYSEGTFVRAENLTIGTNVNLIDIVKNYCTVCKKEIPAYRKQCSNECKFKAGIENRVRKHRQWWDSLDDEDRKRRSEKFQREGTLASKAAWSTRSKDENEYALYEELGLNCIIIDDALENNLKKKLSVLKFVDPVGKVIGKKEIDNNEEWLYDLTVLDVDEENQNFFANEVLVHNSATPYKYDSQDIILNAYAGREIASIDASYLIERGFLVPPKIYFLDPNRLGGYKFLKKRFNTIYKEWIVENDARNNLVIDSVERLLELNKTVLITVSRIPHGNRLMDIMNDRFGGGVNYDFIRGEVNKEKRKELLDSMRKRQLQVMVGTSVADEGLDLPALDSAVIAGGGKSLIKTLQRVGRTLRPYPNAEENVKKEAIVVDFYDNIRYLTGQSKKRMQIYRREKKFQICESF